MRGGLKCCLPFMLLRTLSRPARFGWTGMGTPTNGQRTLTMSWLAAFGLWALLAPRCTEPFPCHRLGLDLPAWPMERLRPRLYHIRHCATCHGDAVVPFLSRCIVDARQSVPESTPEKLVDEGTSWFLWHCADTHDKCATRSI